MNKYLLDVNLLVALFYEGHDAHAKVTKWFRNREIKDWVLCPLTESGFVRIVTKPKFANPPVRITDAMEMLRAMSKLHGYRYLTIDSQWIDLVAPFADRLFGHQQITDSYLLGMAIKHRSILVTLDKAIKTMAGNQFQKHVLFLES